MIGKMKIMIAYKLFKIRKDGTLGPLFINAKQRIPIRKWLEYENHPTPGYAVRPGWHCTLVPEAPHLKLKPKSGCKRIWCKVEVKDVEFNQRPKEQGGTWVIAKHLKVLELMPDYAHKE